MKKVMKVVAALMLTMAMFCIAGCKKTDDPTNGGGNNGGGSSSNDHTYVDLGLPSGTLWATCNVGAETPEEYGNYFAWGEIETKDYYDWNTYKYFNADYEKLTKYCSVADFGYNGYTDDLTVLQTVDDAATSHWGSEWRMPTKEEWQELYQNSVCTWTTQNSVSGRLFTASNGCSIFLPAAGGRAQDFIEFEGVECIYYSSSLILDRPYGAWCFFFGDGNDSEYGDGLEINERAYGLPVRPVRSAK